jgi:hypothetical protein
MDTDILRLLPGDVIRRKLPNGQIVTGKVGTVGGTFTDNTGKSVDKILLRYYFPDFADGIKVSLSDPTLSWNKGWIDSYELEKDLENYEVIKEGEYRALLRKLLFSETSKEARNMVFAGEKFVFSHTNNPGLIEFLPGTKVRVYDPSTTSPEEVTCVIDAIVYISDFDWLRVEMVPAGAIGNYFTPEIIIPVTDFMTGNFGTRGWVLCGNFIDTTGQPRIDLLMPKNLGRRNCQNQDLCIYSDCQECSILKCRTGCM